MVKFLRLQYKCQYTESACESIIRSACRRYTREKIYYVPGERLPKECSSRREQCGSRQRAFAMVTHLFGRRPCELIFSLQESVRSFCAHSNCNSLQYVLRDVFPFVPLTATRRERGGGCTLSTTVAHKYIVVRAALKIYSKMIIFFNYCIFYIL